ncbi:G protein-coupled glucose receptor regulating Gpa2-domain-containing protein, partial [Massariosphaeria phaeospora]
DVRRTFNVRLASAICAAVSIAASSVTFYWFCRMNKRFRHRLIMFLVYGDLTRAGWMFIFTMVSMLQGTVHTDSSFCQASGFMVQYGTETSGQCNEDFAVLVIAVHSAVQVFRPSSTARSDGLYPYRHYVYTGGFIIPGIMASLAFINPHWGYMSQGAFCSLPLRPFWYRLALAWIPRYLIAVIILGLAIAIYTHVGFELRSFADTGQNARPSITTITPILSATDTEQGAPGEAAENQACPNRRASSVAHDVAVLRRSSHVASLIEAMGARPQSIDHAPVSALDLKESSRGPRPPVRRRSTAIDPADSFRGPSLDPGHDGSRTASPLNDPATSHAHRRMVQERNRINKHLKLMFVYPLAYILMWIIPFVNHCMTYQDKWASHPLYWLQLMGTICTAIMGAVDTLIFSFRERPWRHIPTSDGSFLGSFTYWR